MQYTSIAVVLSVCGSVLVSSVGKELRLYGFIIWTISNALWITYFMKTKQTNPSILFAIYLISCVNGIFNNW